MEKKEEEGILRREKRRDLSLFASVRDQEYIYTNTHGHIHTRKKTGYGSNRGHLQKTASLLTSTATAAASGIPVKELWRGLEEMERLDVVAT